MKTVAQLISELQQFPQDLPVFIDISDFEDEDCSLCTAVPFQYTLQSNSKSSFTFDGKRNKSIRKLLIIKR